MRLLDRSIYGPTLASHIFLDYNHFHNILRLFDVFLLPPVKRCAIITYKEGIYELPQELPNDLRLKILENYEISGKCLNSIEW